MEILKKKREKLGGGSSNNNRPVARPSSSIQNKKRRYEEEEEESDLDGFVVSDDEEDISMDEEQKRVVRATMKKINAKKEKLKVNDHNYIAEEGFEHIQKEEFKSRKLGLKEDMEEAIRIAKEVELKKQKMMQKSRKGIIQDSSEEEEE